jgi:oligosaccharide repeat unit polymerase
MGYFIVIIPLFVVFIYRNKFSPILFNPTSVLCLAWLGFLLLHLTFAANYFFSWRAASLILFFVLSFSAGEMLVASSYSTQNLPRVSKDKFYSEYFDSRLRLIIIIMSVISTIGFLFYLKSFVDYYGSFGNLLEAGGTIRYNLGRISVPLFARILLLIGYSAAILCLIYYIINGFSLFITIPFVILFLMGAVQSGRAGFIMLIVFIYFSVYWRDIRIVTTSKLRLNINKRLLNRSLAMIAFAVIVFILGYLQRAEDFSFSRAFDKGTFTNFKVYLLGGISAFDSELKNPENLPLGFGKYSFSALYDLLGIAENKLGVYTKYYPIAADLPTRINIFTSFRPLIDDFGIIGGGIFMFILGLIGGISYNKALNGNLPFLATLIVLYGYLFHTPLLAITVHTSIVLCFFVPAFIIEALRIGLKNNQDLNIKNHEK